MDLSLKQGDTHFLDATITRKDSAGVDQPVPLPTGTKIWWTAKRKQTDDDADAVIRKGTANLSLTGIDITDENEGTCVITIDPADTTDAGKGTVFLWWDMQLRETNGVVTTVNEGRLALTEETTRAYS